MSDRPGDDDGASAGRVLVIDDDPDCRSSICQMLEEEGFETTAADDGAAGLALALTAPPALVLCDVRMPVMDGFETLKALRGSASTAHVPFVFLSAGVDLREVRRGMNQGADDYLVKPFSGADLLETVRARLRRSLPDRPRRPVVTLPDAPRLAGRLLPDLIAGRYRLTGRAGRGGMGAVFQARDVIRGEDVALKFLVDSGRSSDRFERECAILARLDHPRVVRYREHGVTLDGDPFLVMDWLHGEDLAARLARGTLSPDEAARVLRHAAEALAVAHAAGVVHRDVKPSNLFLVDGEIDRLALIDFGVARGPDPGVFTMPGEILGTPGYLAPEQVEDAAAATARSDVFSLGCSVYASLVGHVPFRGATAMASLASLLRDDLTSVRALRPDVPPALDALLTAMLSRDPAARPRDGQGVLDRLDAPP
ncbi:MAG: response regulator [Deltaproteobacteria bacterium]|nr:response regulator [Myxococcales bacterium]MDP3217128.1 response regulator [Deltaproteobacteria bacterium]